MLLFLEKGETMRTSEINESLELTCGDIATEVDRIQSEKKQRYRYLLYLWKPETG